MQLGSCLALLAVLAVSPLRGRAEQNLVEARRRLHLLFEACQTKSKVSGGFPSKIEEIDDLIGPSLSGAGQQVVEFKNPNEKVNRLKLQSPMGQWTPCLRLKVGGDRWLNVANSGWIYESGLYWEREFVHLLPYPFMAPNLLEKDARPMPARAMARSSRCGDSQLELAKYCNALPTKPWFFDPARERNPAFAPLLETGAFDHHGVVFDVRGVIQVDGKVEPDKEGRRQLIAYPKAVTGIAVKQPVRTLHLVAGTVLDAPREAVVATLVFHYKSGHAEKIPLKYGVHLTAADDPQSAPEQVLKAPDGQADLYSLHYLKFTLPQRNEAVETMDFVSGEATSHPFLLGVTVEP